MRVRRLEDLRAAKSRDVAARDVRRIGRERVLDVVRICIAAVRRVQLDRERPVVRVRVGAPRAGGSETNRGAAAAAAAAVAAAVAAASACAHEQISSSADP